MIEWIDRECVCGDEEKIERKFPSDFQGNFSLFFRKKNISHFFFYPILFISNWYCLDIWNRESKQQQQQ